VGDIEVLEYLFYRDTGTTAECLEQLTVIAASILNLLSVVDH
jgi:hypothetical protein